MKLKYLILGLSCLVYAQVSFAQNSYVGKWKTIDDVSGETKAHVEIYEQNGKLYGKIVKVLNEARANAVCTKCTGTKKNQKIEGLIILEKLTKKGDYYGDGYITDPENGKEYKCYVQLVEKGKLKVKGYVGLEMFGRSQFWYKLNE